MVGSYGSGTTPILVTGLHRSGTSWAGMLLAESPRLYYIREPFHKQHAPGICPVEFDRWFQHVSTHNDQKYGPPLRWTVQLRFSLFSQIVSCLHPGRSHFYGGGRGIAWGVREWYRWTRARIEGVRPLIKDPLALLSAEWMADRFEAQVIVLVRHPAGFVRSVKDLGWTHDFRELLEQPNLRSGLLAAWEDELREAARETDSDIIGNAALLWSVMTDVIHKYRRRYPNWKIVRMEDLAMSPIERFQELWSYLDVPVSDQMRDAVREYTQGRPPESEDVGPYTVKRDSRRQALKWKEELDCGTIRRIREETAPVWNHFYREDEWN